MASLSAADQDICAVDCEDDVSGSLLETEQAVERPRRHGSDTRRLTKMVGKRMSPDDHRLLTRYAASLGVDVSCLLEPLFDDLLGRARGHDESRG